MIPGKLVINGLKQVPLLRVVTMPKMRDATGSESWLDRCSQKWEHGTVTEVGGFMRILNKLAIDAFEKSHANSRAAMDNWSVVVEAARWNTTAELKQTFDRADFVKGFTVFNVGGNNFRIIARVIYQAQTLQIVHVFTHSEYDRWKP